MHNITQVDISFALHKCVGVTVLSFLLFGRKCASYFIRPVKILHNINVSTQHNFPKIFQFYKHTGNYSFTVIEKY